MELDQERFLSGGRRGSSEPYLVLNMFGQPDINGDWYS
jgi:hypothetical protein